MDRDCARVCERAREIVRGVDGVMAVGLGGSQAIGQADAYSDVDLQIVTAGGPPPVEVRARLYEGVHGLECGPLDHPVWAEFEREPVSVDFVVDWVVIDGVKCDLLWLSDHGITRLLAAVADDIDHPETIAAWCEGVQPVFDPDGYLRRLPSRCPEYTAGRARRKAGRVLGYAHWFMCDWRVLERASVRGDVLAYQSAETEMVEHLVTALYAVNRAWYHNRRRLRFQSRRFTLLPPALLDTLESMIRRDGGRADLAACHQVLNGLFQGLAVMANEHYPDWDLPTRWSCG